MMKSLTCQLLRKFPMTNLITRLKICSMFCLMSLICLAALSPAGQAAAPAAPAAPPAKTYATDDEGFIRNWLVLDPIPLPADFTGQHTEADEKAYFDRDYVKKMDANPKAGGKLAADKLALTWKAEQTETYDLNFETTTAARRPTPD